MYGILERVEKLAVNGESTNYGGTEHRLHESDTALEEYLLDDLGHLKRVGREVQEGLDIREAVVGEKRVDTKVTSVIGHLVN